MKKTLKPIPKTKTSFKNGGLAGRLAQRGYGKAR